MIIVEQGLPKSGFLLRAACARKQDPQKIKMSQITKYMAKETIYKKTRFSRGGRSNWRVEKGASSITKY